MEEIIYVYESPDGGETVYRRESLGNTRELHSQSDAAKRKQTRMQRTDTWLQILDAAETDPDLQELLDRAQVYYELKKEHQG
jgi:hypothetical protein